jgi:hypothetical protein
LNGDEVVVGGADLDDGGVGAEDCQQWKPIGTLELDGVRLEDT